jgi:hypothetical protein
MGSEHPPTLLLLLLLVLLGLFGSDQLHEQCWQWLHLLMLLLWLVCWPCCCLTAAL